MPINNTRNSHDQGAFSRARGIDMEDMAYYDLIAYFHEIYVHVQPRKRKINFDFIIYAQNATFAVDVFFSNSLSNMKNEARKKINTYSSFGQKVCIVQMNSQLNGNI